MYLLVLENLEIIKGQKEPELFMALEWSDHLEMLQFCVQPTR